MCGPAGSGKTTIARRLEANGMIGLSYDREAWNRGIRHMPLPDDVRRGIRDHLRGRLTALLHEDRDVVLDFSFWSRAMRDRWRRIVMPFGVVPETIHVITDRATCLARVAARVRAHGDDFGLDAATAAAYFDHFEPPTPQEGPLTSVPSVGINWDGDDRT